MADVKEVSKELNQDSGSSAPSGGGGGAGLIHLSGTDWLGIGKTGNAAYQGTARCGSRPNCIAWTADCRKRKDAYDNCVRETTAQDYQLAQMMETNDLKKLGLNNDSALNFIENRNVQIALIALIIIAVIVFVLRR